MAREDFKIADPQFLSTNESQSQEIFDVDGSDTVDVDSELKVKVTASKTGETTIAPPFSGSVTIIEEATTEPPPVGACCVCQSDGVIVCTDGVEEADCDGEWQGADTTCSNNACADVVCTPPSDGNFTLDPPFNGLDRMIIDARFALGEESAILVLSGTGSPGETVQLQDNTTGIWNPVAVVDDAGFWKTNDTDPGTEDDDLFYEAATVTIDRSYNLSGDWYKVRVRYESDEIVVESDNTFLPGFVFMSISQSERAQMFKWGKDNWPVESFPIDNNHNFQLLQHGGTDKVTWFSGIDPDAVQTTSDGGVTGPIRNETAVFPDDDGLLYFTKVPQRYRISLDPDNQDPNLHDPDDLGLRTSRDSSTKFTTTLKHMANMFNETMPNIPVLFVDNQWSGSSRKSLLESQPRFSRNGSGQLQERPVRDFRFTKTCVDWCRRHGTEIGVVDDMWYASDSATFRFDCYFGPHFSNVKIEFPGAEAGVGNFQDFPDGIEVVGVTSDYKHGDFYPPGANNNTTDDVQCWASYFDASTGVKAHELGVGIFRKDRTRWALMSTNRFSTTSVKGSANTLGLWGSWFSNTDVINAKSPQLTFKNAERRYGIDGGDRDTDPDTGEALPTASAGSIDFDVLQGRSRGMNLPRLRRCVFNLANQAHNYFMLTSFDPTVVCHGEMVKDSDGDGFMDLWSDDPHPSGNNVETLASPAGNKPVEYDMDHPDADIVNDFGRALDGTMKMMEYTVLSSARTANQVNIPIPVFGFDGLNDDGEAVFRVENFNGNALPTGSKLETLFSLRNELDDDGIVIDLTNSSWLRDTEEVLGPGKGLEHPNYKKIIGFERGRIADPPIGNTNVPDFDPDSFSYEGFQTEFGTDGLSVRVIPDSDKPFQNGDVIRFNGGGCDSVHLWQSDCMHRIYRAMPILNIPGISAEGIPISAEPRTPIVTISGL